ncbi:unnamed protein product [Agarophyton chilense]|eukprot:gb/GEZJ01002051.1/.p1 GENE.gb/GEZJ01002051.1/~~gb/GEZJ01002051.1/.p1  ORF type:complete len:465 (-),score=64.42 gb/GEZJ01002051.1/:8099-9493(-)
MIRNNRLYYSSADAPWHSVEIEHTALSSFVTSVLITLISYQTAAIVFDVVLGFKKRDEVKLKYLAITILTKYLSSPVAVLNNVFRKDWLTRLYYGGDIPKSTAISRDPEHVMMKTVFTLLLLISAAPIIDVVLLALAMSRTQSLNLDEAGFGAVSLGASELANSLETNDYLSICRTVPFEEKSSDLLDASFLLCESPPLPEDEGTNATGFEISIEQGRVVTRVIFQGSVILSTKYARLEAREGNFAIYANFGNGSSGRLEQTVLQLFSLYCGETNITGVLPKKKNGQFGSESRLISTVGISCNTSLRTEDEKRGVAIDITTDLKKRLTLVSSEKFLLRNELDSQGNFTEVRNITLLQRTKKNASLFALVVSAVLLLLFRIIVRTLLANDVEEGLLDIIEEKLAVSSHTSLVQKSGEYISFRKKYQVGECAHYGMELEELREVERFEGGIVGGDDIRNIRNMQTG